MLQPNRIAGFEVTACALFRAICDASSRHSVHMTEQHTVAKEKIQILTCGRNIFDLKSNLRHVTT